MRYRASLCLFLILLGCELPPIEVVTALHGVAQGGEILVEPSACQSVVVASWPHLHYHQDHCSTPSTPCHHVHAYVENPVSNLEPIVNSKIGLAIEVCEGDAKAVISLGGEVVNIF